MAKSRAATPPKDYESALAEIEAIVAEMESGQLPLDASLAAYKRGA
ncbi:MAG: exodeoxyribonuclease VII small subunit, partial [Thiobacillus sp.]|nr:exodeoxyribonuclease VII small subunit [Thiobacillus sp.]